MLHPDKGDFESYLCSTLYKDNSLDILLLQRKARQHRAQTLSRFIAALRHQTALALFHLATRLATKPLPFSAHER